MFIREIIKTLTPKRIKKFYYWYKAVVVRGERYPSEPFWVSQDIKHYGEKNRDKVIFVIRKNSEATGLLSCYLTFLSWLKINEGTGYIPVIDMETHYYAMIHNKGEKIWNINAWEHYFKRVSKISMKEVFKSKNVVWSLPFTQLEGMLFFDNTEISKDTLSDWYNVDSEYMKLKDELSKRYRNTISRLIDGRRVLGVMIREGYMVLAQARDAGDELYKTHPGIQGHPVQPSMNELADAIETYLKKWNCDYIFVVCETTCIQSFLYKRFPRKVLTTGRKCRNVDELTLSQYREAAKDFYKNYPVVQSNWDYLEEVYVLSKCTSIIAGKCSGSVVACLWNRGKYEHMKLFTKGLY